MAAKKVESRVARMEGRLAEKMVAPTAFHSVEQRAAQRGET